MPKFRVSVDVTMCKLIEVDAVSERVARIEVEQMFSKNPHDVSRDFSHYVSHEIYDVEEID